MEYIFHKIRLQIHIICIDKQHSIKKCLISKLGERTMEERRVRRTKQILKDALIDLIVTRSFACITVKDMIEKADYNRATFYRHYSCKEDILRELMEEKQRGFTDAFQAPFKNKRIIQLPSLTASDLPLFKYILENANFYRLLKTPKQLPGLQDKMMDTIVTLCRESVTHFHSPQSRINNDLMITFRAYGLFGLIREWILSDFEATPEYIANQYIQILNYRPVNITINVN